MRAILPLFEVIANSNSNQENNNNNDNGKCDIIVYYYIKNISSIYLLFLKQFQTW